MNWHDPEQSSWGSLSVALDMPGRLGCTNTHSKTEWQSTCQRVSKEREQFLLNTPGAMSIGTKTVR